MRRLGRLVRLISLTSIISAEENKKKCKMRRLGRLGRLVRLISLTSLISAEKIKNICQNEASWASCASHFASKLNISRGN